MVYQIARAAIVKYHRLGGFISSQFWRLDAQDQGVSIVGFF